MSSRYFFICDLPCVACVGIIFFGARAVFSVNIYHHFLPFILTIIPFNGSVIDVVVTRPRPEYLRGPPLCSVIVNAVSGVGSAP